MGYGNIPDMLRDRVATFQIDDFTLRQTNLLKLMDS
jgi:hypothetical protein